ncbi:MAG: ankyrin repeat domain-containing protein [Sphingomicrobium sp.]
MTGKQALVAMVVALGLAATPAAADISGMFDGDQFVAAVRERDGSKALALMESNPTVVNSRDSKGDTALIVAISKRDPDWAGYLLNHGASPSLAARNGDTPLIAAARVGFLDAAHWLMSLGAKVDGENRAGETALILAVQQRQIPLVKLLLGQGANPDKTDSAQGYSARDYAKRDNRGGEMLRLIEAKKPKPATTATR